MVPGLMEAIASPGIHFLPLTLPDGAWLAWVLSDEPILAHSYSLPGWLWFLQVINVCPDQRLLDSLRDCNKLLDLVQKGLSEYLETKRSAFPR